MTDETQPRGVKITGLIRQEDTVLRLGGCGAPSATTWAADDRQIFSMLDGTGFAEEPKKCYRDRLYAVVGDPPRPEFVEFADYPEQLAWSNPKYDTCGYFGTGSLAIDDHIYHFMSSMSGPWMSETDGTFIPFHMDGIKLIYSPDKGRSWHNQDRSTPVVWESWNQRQRQHMLFFEEDTPGVLGGLIILQMGQNYSQNVDGYVYGYSVNGGSADYVASPRTYGNPDEIIMVRVPKTRILDRDAYEFFVAVRADGTARWTKNLADRGVVWALPKGGRLSSAVYNAPLGLYMMVTELRRGRDKPTGLGFWTAPTPWGPFTQVHEEVTWTPAGDARARAQAPQIMPKWLSADGKSFWLVWYDMMHTSGSQGLAEQQALFSKYMHISTQEEQTRIFLEWQRRIEPYFSFNTQRVDILTG